MKFEWIEIVNLKINSKDNFTIWYESEDMGFLLEDNDLIRFESLEGAKEFINKNIEVENLVEISEYDIDGMKFNLLRGIDKIDNNIILDFWNIIIDLSNSMKFKFSGNIKNDKYNNLYNKLFFGSDIMTMSPHIEEFVAEYSGEEIKILAGIISEGIEIVEKSLDIKKR